jgi:hypothetical protein
MGEEVRESPSLPRLALINSIKLDLFRPSKTKKSLRFGLTFFKNFIRLEGIFNL